MFLNMLRIAYISSLATPFRILKEVPLEEDEVSLRMALLLAAYCPMTIGDKNKPFTEVEFKVDPQCLLVTNRLIYQHAHLQTLTTTTGGLAIPS